ncbi:MAG: hypothetical protein K2Y28_04320 [Burkholderiaceae bacterium]|nr:hypothetical protein [Burkholderiaceae bacterium]
MTIEAYENLRQRGAKLAGGIGDLSRRACVYHHLYADSGGRNVFPLIAAHGALWAAGYFNMGIRAGKFLSLGQAFNEKRRCNLIKSLDEFADKFRDINRRVCAESYAIYHYTKIYGYSDAIEQVIGKDFLEIICQSHEASQLGLNFEKKSRAQLFFTFFHWEQENIVAPSINSAYEQFKWELIKSLALRPKIEFSYFGKSHALQFVNFSSKEERIVRGFQAYERAEQVGLDSVEEALSLYKVLPKEFILNPNKYFGAIETAIA